MVCLKLFFSAVCFSATVYLVIECFQTYWKNEDVCLVSFKRFNENADQVYPTITLCINNPIQQKKLKRVGKGNYNTSTFKGYLEGYYVDEELKNVDYEEVTVDLNEYLMDYKVRMPNQYPVSYKQMSSVGQIGWKEPYTSFRRPDVKCFSFDIPYNHKANIQGVSIMLNSSIFSNETRPDEWQYDLELPGIAFAMHLKSQMLLSYSTMRFSWDKRSPDDSKYYRMEFAVNSLDIETYRSKKKEPCVEGWKDYDRVVYDDLMNQVECQVEYWKLNKTRRYCNSTKEFEKVDGYLSGVLTNVITPPPPCRTIKQAQYNYRDVEESNVMQSSGINIVVDFKNLNNHYKEIKQVEAYSAESLMGK
jgi:hypothetical protein